MMLLSWPESLLDRCPVSGGRKGKNDFYFKLIHPTVHFFFLTVIWFSLCAKQQWTLSVSYAVLIN